MVFWRVSKSEEGEIWRCIAETFYYEKFAKRGGYGGKRCERLDFQKKVGTKYESLYDITWTVLGSTMMVEDMDQVRELWTKFFMQHLQSC
ncbi:hypothetical protein RND81_03G063300 [Saponaria officinalis]|uniref:Uncharacterized protein n=1 Tax=Saponaria officinalis TaxID=3572 RepID=A0AAW1M330_SAPOF